MNTLAALLFLCAGQTVTAHGLRLPAGFEVTEFADAALAHDIHCLTIDGRGRIFVSGRGYLRELRDDDGDGRADRALDYAHAPKDGAQGLYGEGDSLYCVGDGGLRVFRNRQRPSELLFRCKTGGEHTAHAVARGPDGWLYLLVGDQTGITSGDATLPTSPVKDPVGGCVLRFPPDFKGCEIFAHGFRNAYGMDWNRAGDLFTFDSDNERCVSLPWYEPTRCYHVVPGGHHGWLAPRFAATWRYPPYFPDVVPPVATLGRGSPTGVVCYKHAQFPARYRGGLFLLDWTFGQVHFVSLTRKGSSYAGRAEVFLRSVGDNGFAPTAAAVHPATGDLYVAIGGRGTRGAVYRIRHPAGLRALDVAEVARQRSYEPRARARALSPALARASGSSLAEVRAVQKELGDIGAAWAKGTVWEGYSRRSTAAKVSDVLRADLRHRFPSRDDLLNREIARTLALIEDDDPAVLAKVAARLTADSHPSDDLHYLIVLARLKAPRTPAITAAVAAALLGLDRKIEERRLHRESNWPLRLAELHAGLAARDPALARTLLEHADFGRPDHALFCRAKGFDRQKAAELFLARAAKDEGFAWNAELVNLLGELPAERSLPVLRKLRGEAGLDDVLLPLLAKHARQEDLGWFVARLDSPRLALVEQCLEVLERFPVPAGSARGQEALQLALALRGLPPGKEEDRLRTRVLARLSRHAGRRLASAAAALAWFRQAFPAQAAALDRPDGVDVAAWRRRLARIDWDKGDPNRGKKAYTRASCASCHSGVQALGPDLRGITGRFSRDDLFTAILQPSKDVSPRYRTTQLTTVKGQTYQGIIVYEAFDSVLLLTGPAQSVRLAHEQISERRLTATSLMPAGLLDGLKDEEIADLFAYLRSLGTEK